MSTLKLAPRSYVNIKSSGRFDIKIYILKLISMMSKNSNHHQTRNGMIYLLLTQLLFQIEIVFACLISQNKFENGPQIIQLVKTQCNGQIGIVLLMLKMGMILRFWKTMSSFLGEFNIWFLRKQIICDIK